MPAYSVRAAVLAAALHDPKAPVDLKADGSAEVSYQLADGTVVRGEWAVARHFARVSRTALYGDRTAESSAEVDHWIGFSERELKADFGGACAALNTHLRMRTFLVGHGLTLADIAVWAQLRESFAWLGLRKRVEDFPHVIRLMAHLDSLPAFQAVGKTLQPKKPGQSQPAAQPAAQSSGAAAADKGKGKPAKKDEPSYMKDQGSFNINLPGAEQGKVVTRFPPEPSGYMHIGHIKAALLNDHFAKMYSGKLIIRFDDTNPSKENDDFVQSILDDCKSMEIVGHQITYTSDHFQRLYDEATRMIKEGKAYVDDTDVDTMREERMVGTESKCRNQTVDENLKLWAEMFKGTKKGLECCVRAKIDMQDKNKCMRDPVMYRCNTDPHHRTGAKWKVYPCYDFACPLVDSWEGVTHALRTSEYKDREALYYWVIEAMGVRRVNMWDFSRMNFVNTTLSKRKLNWFVGEGKVWGWDDPRFPTVRGILRRGMTVPALRQFIISQGASKNTNLMEWDKIWAINKKMIDPVSPRYVAVDKKGMVEVTLTNGPGAAELVAAPLHQKNADLGTKIVRRTNRVLMEQEDAKTVAEGEKITFMTWGNAVVNRIARDGGAVAAMEATLMPDDTDFKSTKKFTWLGLTEDVIPVRMFDFDHLLTKKSLEEGDKFEDFINPNSLREWDAVGESNLRALNRGDIVQVERKGYFVCDRPYVSAALPMVLFMIPDGKGSVDLEKAKADKKAKAEPAAAAKSNKQLKKEAAAAAAASKKPIDPALEKEIAAQGEKVRQLKADKADKDVIKAEVDKLLALKAKA